MNCYFCKRDLNKIYQDNMSPYSGFPICEDCNRDLSEKEWEELKRKEEKDDDTQT